MTNKKNKSKYINNLIFRCLICSILVMSIALINKFSPNTYIKIKNNIFNKSFNFAKLNILSKKIIGKNVFYSKDKSESELVMNDNISSKKIEKYHDAEKIYVSDSLPIGSIESGIVIYSGIKDDYGNTIIIQGVDGYNIWYANVENIEADLYSYIEKGELIASAKGNYIYLLIEKNGQIYSYEEYKNNKN